MPETALGYAYLAALAEGNDSHRAELAAYAEAAGVDAQGLVTELTGTPDLAELANETALNTEAYPLAAATVHVFRTTDAYRAQVLDRLALGNESICDFGNLYTAALPAWLAAGFEIALKDGANLDGQELLTMGYGSGDAAEVIPFAVQPNWRAAAARIRFEDAMHHAVELTQSQYERLHDRQRVPELEFDADDEFLVDHVGSADSRHFRDFGIEYYRYVASRELAKSA
jgi:hydroxymethylglutaryl-CoA synthase